MQPFQCDLQPQRQETHRTTHTGTTIVAKHIEGTKRPQPHPPHTRGTFHFIAGCSHFTQKNTRFRAPASSPQHTACNIHASSPLPFVITSQSHHFPLSPLPFVTTSLRHHFPSSPLPIVTTSLPHRFPSSAPLPIVTTSIHHHFSSSPLPFVTTLCHSFLFFCCVLLCDLPPFIKVNSIASYSFVMYCYVMYCYMMYHPSSRSIPSGKSHSSTPDLKMNH